MRVLMVHNDYAEPSGEEKAAETIAGLLTSQGHEVFWFRRSSVGIENSFVKKAKAFFAGIHNPVAARALAQKLDEIRPDLVQVQNIYPWLSTSIFKPIRQRGIPIVMRCPNYRLFCPNGLHLFDGGVCEKCLGWGREAWCVLRNCEGSFFKSTGYALRNAWARISGIILRNVDMFIVQTPFQKQKFTERGIPESRIGIVPGLVPKNGFPESLDCGDLVTFVGRVSPEKGIEDFLAAARLMPDVPFAVAGNESGMPGISAESPPNVQWFGFLQSDSLRELYMRSRIVVVPSRCHESFSNSLIEAMRYGRPVIASRIGAIGSIVDENETGFLFEVGKPCALAEKVHILYQDQELCRKMGEAGREKVLTQYSSEIVYTALASVYHKALRHKQNRA